MARQYAIGGPLGVSYVIDAEDRDFALAQVYIASTVVVPSAYNLPAVSGSYALTGQTAILEKSRVTADLVTPVVGAVAASATTASFTPVVGTLLVAVVGARPNTGAIPTISDSLGGVWTEVPTSGISLTNVKAKLWTHVVTVATARTVTGASTGATSTGIGIVAVTGGNNTVLTNFASDTDVAGDPSLTLAAFQANSIGLGFMVGNAGATGSTPPSGYTELYDALPATNLRLSLVKDEGASPSTTLAWVSASTDSIGYGLEIRASGPTVYILPAVAGSYALTGAAATLTKSAGLVHRTLPAVAGSYALTGTAATLTKTTVGGALWTPAEIPTGHVGWYDAADSSKLTFSGSNLTVWTDKSPAANNATPFSTGPTLTSVNSLGSLYFNQQGLKTTTAISLGDFTVFVVFTPGAGGSYERLVDQDFTNGFWFGRDATSLTWGGGIRLSVSPYGYFVPLADGSCHQSMMRRSGTTQYHSGNGGAVTTSSACTGTVTTSSAIAFGTSIGDVSTDRLSNDVISEVLIWSNSLAFDDQAKVEGYLAWKWGIQASLPIGHPYKSAAPTTGAPAGYTLPAAAGSYALTGAVSSLEYGRVAAAVPGSYALTGTATSLEFNREVLALSGSYALTGQATSMELGKEVLALAGSYALTGQTVSLEYGWEVLALPASYALTGTAASFRRAWKTAAVAGSYTLSGQPTAFARTWKTTAVAGAYTLSGLPANLLTVGARAIIGLPGAYALTGATTSLEAGREVLAVGGSYAFSGQVVSLEKGREVLALAGSYALTGQPSTLSKIGAGTVLTAEAGSYALIGSPVTLVWSGEIVVTPPGGGGMPWYGRPSGGRVPSKQLRKAVRELIARQERRKKPKKAKELARELIASIKPKGLGIAEKRLVVGLLEEGLQGLWPIYFASETIHDKRALENAVLYLLAQVMQRIADEEEEDEEAALLLLSA